MADTLAASDAIILDWALAVAALSALLHVAAPHFRNVLRRHEVAVGSLGGGMAVAYVFLHLFRELEVGETILGRRIHFLVLVGFVGYYGIEHSLGLRAAKVQAELLKRHHFTLDLTLNWIYGWLFLYALPDTLKADGLLALPLLLAVVLHLINTDFGLSDSFERGFDRWGRYVLASAPLVGWLTDLFYFKDDPLVSSVATALLAGSCLYKTFKQELPETSRSRFRWFLCGVTVFALLHFLAGDDFFSANVR